MGTVSTRGICILTKGENLRKPISNGRIKSNHSLHKGDILGGKAVFLMTQKSNALQAATYSPLLIGKFLQSSFKAVLL